MCKNKVSNSKTKVCLGKITKMLAIAKLRKSAGANPKTKHTLKVLIKWNVSNRNLFHNLKE
jgi:hypothetical protein